MHIGTLYQQDSLQSKLSVTIGTATLLPADTQDSLLARADNALYRAKQKGRNCVETSINAIEFSTC